MRKHTIFTSLTRNNTNTNMKIGYDNKVIPPVLHTTFLGINIDSALSWRTCIEWLVSKLSTACYIIRSIKPYVSHTTLIMIHYSLFHSIVNCSLMFWGSSSYNCKIFRMQKRVIRIIMGCKSLIQFLFIFHRSSLVTINKDIRNVLQIYVYKTLRKFVKNIIHLYFLRYSSKIHLY